MIDLFTSFIGLISQLNTVLLLITLILIFVIAFKVLEMVMQTVLVSALSGGFYIVLSYYIETVSFSIDSLLFFMVIGGTLYTSYNLLTTSASILTKIVKLPIKIGRQVIEFVKKRLN